MLALLHRRYYLTGELDSSNLSPHYFDIALKNNVLTVHNACPQPSCKAASLMDHLSCCRLLSAESGPSGLWRQ